MKPNDVKRLYDADYASSYEAKFLTSEVNYPDTEFELKLVGELLPSDAEWLDVACGTGYFLKAFPHMRRMGADLSPAMLERARSENPGVEFHEHDFRMARPEWVDRFGLVSCMWYAYTLVDTIQEIDQVVANLAAWTRADGTCFVPLADPRLISRCNLPYHIQDRNPGQVVVTGILWSFSEADGTKVHQHLVTPQVEYMTASFGRFFEDIRIVIYPHKADGIHGRPALVARGKRS